MRSNYRLCALIMSLSLYCGGGIASAQTRPAGQPQTTASDASHGSVKLDMEPSLIVMNARGASLQGQMLTLNDISSNSIVFADRPVRAAGHAQAEVCRKTQGEAVAQHMRCDVAGQITQPDDPCPHFPLADDRFA